MHEHTAIQLQSAAPPAFTPARRNLLQRKCACGGIPGPTGECAECRKKRLGLQRRAADQAATPSAPPIVQEVLRSPGKPLDTYTRSFMEGRFGHDFSRVRVHADEGAAESARAVNALAYIVGSDVVFDTGRYAPETSAGRRLLAHELTHVVQQSGGAEAPLQRQAMDGGTGPLEVEAERVASEVATTGSTEPAKKEPAPVKAPTCEAAERSLERLKQDLEWLTNELNKTPPNPRRVELLKSLLRTEVDGIIAGLDGYIAEGCCEPHLKTLEAQVSALPWPADADALKERDRLIDAIRKAQEKARKDHEHC